MKKKLIWIMILIMVLVSSSYADNSFRVQQLVRELDLVQKQIRAAEKYLEERKDVEQQLIGRIAENKFQDAQAKEKTDKIAEVDVKEQEDKLDKVIEKIIKEEEKEDDGGAEETE